MSKHDFMYTPIMVGAEQRYSISLPEGKSPVRFWTVTTDMKSWLGEVLEVAPGAASAAVRQGDRFITVVGKMSSMLMAGMPCYVMEHLTIEGKMEYLIGGVDIQMGNKNFINFGVPNEKHLRIDLYTGESRIINDYS